MNHLKSHLFADYIQGARKKFHQVIHYSLFGGFMAGTSFLAIGTIPLLHKTVFIKSSPVKLNPLYIQKVIHKLVINFTKCHSEKKWLNNTQDISYQKIDCKLKTNTFNMYDSSQTDIVNIFAGKEGWGGRVLSMHIERGRELVLDKNLGRKGDEKEGA